MNLRERENETLATFLVSSTLPSWFSTFSRMGFATGLINCVEVGALPANIALKEKNSDCF